MMMTTKTYLTFKIMPIYEIKLTCTKMICVEAEDEFTAIEVAEENSPLDMDNATAEIEDEFNESISAEKGFIEYYKRNGEFYTDK